MKLTNSLPRPTDAELAILTVLWEKGPSTVRDIHEATTDRGTGYTTVLKMLQIMNDKGLVSRQDTHKAHVYTAVQSRQKSQRNLIADLADRAFGGSSTILIQQALAAKPATTEELAEIRRMIDEMEAKNG